MTVATYNGERNRWRVFVSAGTDDHGKRVRVTEVVDGPKRDALRREREIKSALDTGSYVARGPKTFGEFVEAWWPSKQASVAATTAREYRRVLDRAALPILRNRPIQKITGGEIGTILAPIVERGALSLAEHTFVILRIVFNAAVRQGVVGKSPMSGVERPKAKSREMTVLDPQDWQRVKAHLKDTNSWALTPLTVLITTGLRRSELCGLQWSDLDFENSLLHVRRVYHVLQGGPLYQEPKTNRSRRVVAVDAGTLDMLRAHRRDANRTAEMFGRAVAPNDPVFARTDGTPFPPDTYSGLWRRIRKTLGLTSRLHDLRHSSATIMLAAGVPAHLVSSRLGHATAGFTLSTYAHALPGQQEAAVT